MNEKVDILGVKIDNLSVKELISAITGMAVSGGRRTVLYANTKTINLAQNDPEFKSMLAAADILHSDGWGVVWACRMKGVILKEKIVTTDFFMEFCRELARSNIRMYFLGARPRVIEKAKDRMVRNIPGIKICGQQDGYFNEAGSAEAISRINALKPDILVVGMGTPKQEKWILDNRSRLDVPLCWAVGGLFDFISGEVKRAPAWMRKLHLEWLFRLLLEPGRFWRRYLVGNLVFVFRILKFKVESARIWK